MKKLMCLMLVLGLSAVATADIVTIEVARDVSGATQEFARLRYDGATVDYWVGGSWMMIGDHIGGANHYSDAVTKFNLAAAAIPAGSTINSVTLKGYYHENGNWDGSGNTYMRIEKYTSNNGTVPITLADSPDTAATSYVTTLAFGLGETQYSIVDAALTAAVAADFAAGNTHTSFTWQASDPAGNALANGGVGNYPYGDIYMIGFPLWEWAPSYDIPALVIDYTVPEPATMTLLALGSVALLKRKKA